MVDTEVRHASAMFIRPYGTIVSRGPVIPAIKSLGLEFGHIRAVMVRGAWPQPRQEFLEMNLLVVFGVLGQKR